MTSCQTTRVRFWPTSIVGSVDEGGGGSELAEQEVDLVMEVEQKARHGMCHANEPTVV